MAGREAARSIRIVPARSTLRMEQKANDVIVLGRRSKRFSVLAAEANLGTARLSRERGRGWRRGTTNGALARVGCTLLRLKPRLCISPTVE